jgi:hypothetical protein
VVGFVPGGGVGAGKEGELEGDDGEEAGNGEGEVRALEGHKWVVHGDQTLYAAQTN